MRWESNPLSSKATVLQTAPTLRLWRSPIYMELVAGIEPTTYGLQIRRSTIWAIPANGADAENWTLDILLTKQSLYHLSYISMAGVEGFEPSPTILETVMLPITPNPYWRCVRDLNPWPPAWQAGVLTNWTNTPFSLSKESYHQDLMEISQLLSGQNLLQPCAIM